MKNRPQNRKQPAAGFTLMEVLVALMVLSITLTVILQLFSGGLRAERLSEDYTRAIFCSKSAMEEILLAEQMTEETLQGECPGGYKWQAEITLLHPPGQNAAPSTLFPFRIDMDVNWQPGQGGKHFTLSTLHLAQLKGEGNGP